MYVTLSASPATQPATPASVALAPDGNVRVAVNEVDVFVKEKVSAMTGFGVASSHWAAVHVPAQVVVAVVVVVIFPASG